MARYPKCASNPKRAVRVVNPDGAIGWTSIKGAIRLLAQGRARFINQLSIEIIAEDYRAIAAGRTEPAAKSTWPPALDVSYLYEGPANLRTFAHYPDALAFVY